MDFFYLKKNFRGKFFAVARCCLMLLLLAVNTQAANSQQTKITIKCNNVTAKQLFKEIERNSSYSFVYKTDDIADIKHLDADYKNEDVTAILNDCLRNTHLNYSLTGYHITIFKKTEDKDDKEKKEITGIVTDKKGNPLPGVSVVLKGTRVGVATDSRGEFKIKGNKGDILVFSFVGMKKAEKKIEKFEGFKIILEEESEGLDEVVVTGYQVIEKRKMTSAVVSVEGKDIIEPAAISVDNMLQGKITGVSVMNQTATPGAAPKIRIRGSSSITGNREPVWVVDGVILEDPVKLSATELNSMDKVNLIGNAISFINPEDIDRIDILKDASATAIYGVKAANGVIVITTKKGKYGKPSITYTNSTNFMDRPNYDIMEQMNSKQRIEVSEEMHRRGLSYTEFGPSNVAYEGALMDYWDKKITYSDFRRRVHKLKEQNTDWYDLLFRRVINQSHNISISGAGDKTNYYASIGYSEQKGVDKGVDYRKYNAMLKINTKLTDKISLGINLNSAVTENDRPHENVDLYQYAYETSRAIPAYNEDGTRHFYANADAFKDPRSNRITDPIGFNIFNELEHSGSNITNKMMFMTINLDWKIAKFLRYNCTYNISKTSSEIQSWTDAESFDAQVKRKLPYGVTLNQYEDHFKEKSLLPYGGELANRTTNTDTYMVRNSLRFNQHFGEHSFTSNLGFEIRSSKVNGYSDLRLGYLRERGEKFADVKLSEWDAYRNRVEGIHPDIVKTENNFVSYYGTFSYGFKSRYILNFNLRADGSNKFGEDKSTRFLPIWSLSGRWNMRDENFMSGADFLDDLSLRCSYGVQGNVSEDNIPNLILTMGSLDGVSGDFYSKLHKVPNNRLKWEKTKSYNLGMDFSVFKNVLSGTVELYHKKGEDQIVSKMITTTNGAEKVAINEGNVENKGWEITVNANIINNDKYQWGLSFNTAKNYNKITNAGNPTEITYLDYTEGTIIRNGKSVNSFYSYMFDRLDSNGYPVFKNFNEKDEEGKYLVNNYEEAYNRIFTYSGKREPDLTGGFSSFFRYKNFAVNTIFAFNIGNKIRLNNLYKSSGQRLPYPQQNMSRDYLDRWQKPGDEKFTNIPTLSEDPLLILDTDRKYKIAENKWEMYNNSDMRVVDGSFLRCRSISFSYGFNKDLFKKIGLKSLNLNFSVANLFVIKDKDLEGRDPEQVTFGAGAIPPQKTYSLRLSANF